MLLFVKRSRISQTIYFYFNYVYVGMSMDVRVQVLVESRGIRPTGSFKSVTWVLGIDLGFSARTRLPLNR